MASGKVINTDTIECLTPAENGICNIHYKKGTCEVISQEEFDKITQILSVEDEKQIKELTSVITRLITAIDRLGIRIPTSIRMHM